MLGHGPTAREPAPAEALEPVQARRGRLSLLAPAFGALSLMFGVWYGAGAAFG